MSTLGKIIEYLTKNDYKTWSYRKYEFTLFFCSPAEGKMPWNEAVWNTIAPVIDSLLVQSSEYKNTGVKVLKLQKQDNSEYYKEIKHGRFSWNNNSHSKWTVKDNEKDIHFSSFELWTPIWTICEKMSSPPDIFMHINNEISLNNADVRQFDALVVLAIATDLKINSQDQILNLSQIFGSKKTVSHIRKWSKGKRDKDKNWKFRNWIQDTFSNGIYRGKSLHDFDFDELVFQAPYWNILFENERNKNSSIIGIKLSDLIGQKIIEIRCNYIYENEYEMQEFHSYIKLSSGLIFEIPYYPNLDIAFDEDLNEKFDKGRKANASFMKKIKNKKIVNFHYTYFEDELVENSKPFIELEDDIYLTELNYGPIGITSVDMQIYTKDDFNDMRVNLEEGFEIRHYPNKCVSSN